MTPARAIHAFGLLAASAPPLRERLQELVGGVVRIEAEVVGDRTKRHLGTIDRPRGFRGRSLRLSPRRHGLFERCPARRATCRLRALPARGFVGGHGIRCGAAVGLDATHPDRLEQRLRHLRTTRLQLGAACVPGRDVARGAAGLGNAVRASLEIARGGRQADRPRLLGSGDAFGASRLASHRERGERRAGELDP
jgi:hypothetical protein